MNHSNYRPQTPPLPRFWRWVAGPLTPAPCPKFERLLPMFDQYLQNLPISGLSCTFWYLFCL